MAAVNYNGPNGLSRRAKRLAMANWYEADDFTRTVAELKTMNPNIQANRDNMSQKLNTNKLENAPYGQAKRFPVNSDYVCEAHGVWPGLFKQLRMGLYHKEKANVFQRGDTAPTNGNAGKPNPDEQQSNDAFTAISNALEAMSAKLINGEDLIDQFYFETALQQRWTRKNGDKWEVEPPKVQIGDETVLEPNAL